MSDRPSGTQPASHDLGNPSDWVQRWAHLAKPAGNMLDVACGRGRHMAWFERMGFCTTGIDRSADALRVAGQYGTAIQADIEIASWPLMRDDHPQQFDVVVVTNYLWRALFPIIVQSLAPGGLLIYETFAAGNERVGKPSRADFLLHPAELLLVCQTLNVISYENGFLNQPDRFVQRIAAVAPQSGPEPTQVPIRYPLSLK